jgi:hypothetical protein
MILRESLRQTEVLDFEDTFRDVAYEMRDSTRRGDILFDFMSNYPAFNKSVDLAAKYGYEDSDSEITAQAFGNGAFSVLLAVKAYFESETESSITVQELRAIDPILLASSFDVIAKEMLDDKKREQICERFYEEYPAFEKAVDLAEEYGYMDAADSELTDLDEEKEIIGMGYASGAFIALLAISNYLDRVYEIPKAA